MTKVSIITPCYNTPPWMFSRSLESINTQTCRDFEWIVVNDGSTDTLDFPVDISTDSNYGPSVARNLGFQISSGNIITYLDMGDVLYENRVETLIKLFEKYKVQLIFSGYDMQEEGKEPFVFNHFDWISNHPKYPTALEYIKTLQKQNITIPMGVAHTRKPFVEVGGFQRGIVCGEDGILWRRMIDKIPPTEIMFSDDRAGRYFISETGQSRTQRRFEMGGFAFDGRKKDNGKYLDESWFKNYSSEDWYE